MFTAKAVTMKKLFLLSFIFTILLSTQVFSAVTTSDGVIKLDFYADSQSGIENRWILDMTINDVDGTGGLEEINFGLTFLNLSMDFDNQYNSYTEYYI